MGSIDRSPRSRSRRLAACLAAVALACAAFLAGPLAPAGRGHGSAVLAAQEPNDPFFLVMQAFAFDEGKVLVVSPEGIVTDEDIFGDVIGLNEGLNDLTGGAYAWLPTVPQWLLDAVFGCSMPDVACPKAGSADAAFSEGAYLFYERLAGPPGSIAATKRGEWGPILALEQYPTAPVAPGEAFGGASHAVITRIDRGMKDVLYFNHVNGTFPMFATDSRSRWKDNDFLTLVPKAKEVQTAPVGWDVYAFSSDYTEPGTGRDTIRGFDGVPLLTFDPAPTIEFQDAPAASSAAPASRAGASPGASGSAAAAPSPSGVAAPTSTPGIAWWPLAILIGVIVALIGFWLLFGRGPKGGTPQPEPPPGPEPPTPPTPPTPEPPPPEPRTPPAPLPPGGPVGPVDPGPSDPGPIPPPVPPIPPPPPKQCKDGDEEWREERPAQSFVVPPADGKVRIASDPTTAPLEAWLFAFGFPRGAPFAAFVGLGDEERDRILDGLPTTPSEMHWTIEFQLDDYRLACQRKWVCEADVWVPTDELRLLQSGPDPYFGRFAIDGPALTVDDVRRIWKDTRAVLVAAEAAVSSMKAYQAGCT